ncbi:hypothetical protein, partial [Aeromonas veronii]|uniref:hypothetical protein n=1 Tax=Aeromonas veronii TaxID=654 RepID=UPI003B9F46DB
GDGCHEAVGLKRVHHINSTDRMHHQAANVRLRFANRTYGAELADRIRVVFKPKVVQPLPKAMVTAKNQGAIAP